MNSKRQRRNIRDLPQSSEFIFTSDKDHRKSSNVRLILIEQKTHTSIF